MMLLTRQNSLIQNLKNLRQESQERILQQQIVITGRKVIEEALKLKLPLLSLFRSPLCRPLSLASIDYSDYLVDDKTLAWACGQDHFPKDGCAAIVKMPPSFIPTSNAKLLVLDRLQDPGNVGTLIRSAAAFKFDGVICLKPCCDPYNEKAIRASMGSCLHIPIYLCDYCDFELLVKNYAPNLYAADLDRSSRLVDSHFQWNPYPWLIIGNESHGVSPELKALANSVHIMIGSSVDSLNAAVAGSILLYAISQSTS